MADRITGTSGNDIIQVPFITSRVSNSTTVYAGSTKEDLPTTDLGDDRIYGGNWADHTYAGAGNDTLAGGDYHDWVYAGDGDDRIVRGDIRTGSGYDGGFDWLYGGGGDDVIFAEYSFNRVFGGDGNDTLYGRGDVMSGGAGDDRLYFSGTNGVLTDYWEIDFWPNGNAAAGDGNDFIFGSSGAELIYGGDGDDRIYAGSGSDSISGDGGNDMIIGGRAGDRPNSSYVYPTELSGGDGDDWLDFRATERDV